MKLIAGLAGRKGTTLVTAPAAPRESLFFIPKINHFGRSWHKPRSESWIPTISPSVTIAYLVHGCRGHNCDENNREIHEAIPDVMAVLHENPDLQQGLLDAAADTTSAAVVAPLTFNTYFSLAGDASIDHDDDDALQARHRHQSINSYFSDEEDDQSSPSGGEEVDDETRDDEELGSNEDEPPLDTFFLPPFSDSVREGFAHIIPTLSHIIQH